MVSDSCHKLMVLGNLKGIGAVTLMKLSTMSSFNSSSLQELSDADPRLEKALKENNTLDKAQAKVDKEISLSNQHEIKILCFYDNGYPLLLNDTFDKPLVLYVKGELATDQTKSISVIGTRNPTPHGELIAERITQYFARDNWSIISGLALGCDAIAHRTALREGSHTVAVLAHGLNTIAPSQHKGLASQILDNGGALITEYSFFTAPNPYQFVARDRIQAGLAKGVIMIQSKLNGGSLHASRAAIHYNRVLAVPKPTIKDITDYPDSVQANIVLSSNDDIDKINILKCDNDNLKGLFILNDSNDYQHLSFRLNSINNKAPTVTIKKQLKLF